MPRKENHRVLAFIFLFFLNLKTNATILNGLNFSSGQGEEFEFWQRVEKWINQTKNEPLKQNEPFSLVDYIDNLRPKLNKNHRG